MKERGFGKAHDNFQHARVNPDYLEARYTLALAFKSLKQNEGQKELGLCCVKPDVADAWAQLGQIAVEEGQNELAIEHLQGHSARPEVHLGLAGAG